jgi:uncharacterized protein YydD (DUF2326 family)
MSAKILTPRFLHLQHKRSLLLAEKSFLKDKLAFVQGALTEVNQALRTLKKG